MTENTKAALAGAARPGGTSDDTTSVQGLTSEDRAVLRSHAITDEVITAWGFTSYRRGIEIPVRDMSGGVLYSRKRVGDAHRQQDLPKYLGPGGKHAVNVLRVAEGDIWALVEGDLQSFAALSYLPAEVGVVTMFGCQGTGGNTDLSWANEAEVYVVFDKDRLSNHNVALGEKDTVDRLMDAGARTVKTVDIPGKGTDGLDDVLARITGDSQRTASLNRWFNAAKESRHVRKVPVITQAQSREWLNLEIGQGELSCLFRRNGELVHTPRIGDEGYVPPSGQGNNDGPAQVRPIATPGVKALVEARYRVGRNKMSDKRNRKGEVVLGEDGNPVQIKKWQAELFPGAAVASVVEAARIGEGAPNLRDLRGVTHTPVLRKDGSVLDTPGYDPATGLLFLPDTGLSVPPIPENPTPEQVKAAVELILTPIAEFPFVQEAHRANWVGLAMTPLLRDLLPPPYRLGMVDATNPGSGKGFLVDIIMALHGGVMRGEFPADKDEFRKQLTTILIETTAPVVSFDNVTGVLRSSVLEALLTSATYSDRWLGQNREVTAANDRVWLVTGNNAKIGGDLARRTLYVSLDPGVDRPAERTGFKLHPPTWVREHRGELLAAMLTVARAWVLAGKPMETTRSDSYALWEGSLRGMLAWAGFPGVFGGEDSTSSVESSDDAEWADFLEAVHEQFADKPFTVAELVGRIGGNWLDTACLPGDLAVKHAQIRDGNDGSFRKSLGHWLANRDGRFARGWRVKKVSAKGDRTAKFQITSPSCGSSVLAVLPAPKAEISTSHKVESGATDRRDMPSGGAGREGTAGTAEPQPVPDEATCPKCGGPLRNRGGYCPACRIYPLLIAQS